MLLLFSLSLIIGAVGYEVAILSFLELSVLGLLWGGVFLFLLRSKRAFVLSLALFSAVFVGSLRFWAIPMDSVPPVGNQALTGTVLRVDDRLDRTLLVVRPDEYKTKVQVILQGKRAFLPGDRISFRGKIELPEDFVTETGRVFDYGEYLNAKGVSAVVYRAQVVKLSEKEGGIILLSRTGTVIRRWIAEQLSAYISFPIDGVVSGMLVGFQGGIPKDVSDIFKNTGTLHTLVLSGYNITVFAGFLAVLLRRAPFKIKIAITFIGIALLVLISGAGVASVRAGIMGSIALLAGATLSSYNVFRALLIAFLFFFFTSPNALFVDPGLHLSFLATFFIIAILPVLKEKFVFIPDGKWGIRENILLAVGLPVWMIPYLMYFSGVFPLVSPIANIIMVPIIPILMLGGLVILVLSFASPLAGIVGAGTSVVGSVLLKILSALSLVPSFRLPSISGWLVVIIYGVFGVLFFKREIFTFLKLLRSIFQQRSS